MSEAPSLSSWIELFLLLAVEVTAVVGLATLAARLARAAVWQRTIWQISSLGLVLLIVIEGTGVGRGIVHWTLAQPKSPQASSGLHQARPADAGATPLAQVDSFMTDLSPWGDSLEPEIDLTSVPSITLLPFHPLIPAPGEPATLPRSAAGSLLSHTSWWPGLLWALGATILIGRILFARLLLMVFRRRHPPLNEGELFERVRVIARCVGMRRHVQVTLAQGLSGPIAFGLIRPTIGLPVGFVERFDESQQQAMLAHELAHLSAHDPSWHLLSDLVAAAFWWHPLAGWSRHALRAASECAADEASLVVRDGPGALAACLVELGAQLLRPRPAAWVRIQGNGFRSSLGRRVERLLGLSGRAWRPPGRATSCVAKTLGPAAMVAVALVCTAWSSPAELPKGESMIQTLQQSWRHSLAALTLIGFFGSGEMPAMADPPADESAAASTIGQEEGEKVAQEVPAEKQDRELEARARIKEKQKAIEKQADAVRAAGNSEEAEKLTQQAYKAKEQLLKQYAEKGKDTLDSLDGLRARLKKLEAENAELRQAILAKEKTKVGEEIGVVKEKLLEKQRKLEGKKGTEAPAGIEFELNELDGRILKLYRAGMAEEAIKLQLEAAIKAKESYEKAAAENSATKSNSARQAIEQLEKQHWDVLKRRDAKESEDATKRRQLHDETLQRVAKEHGGKVPVESAVQAFLAAGLAEEAERLSSVVEKMKAGPAPELERVVRELREEMTRLRDEVAELRKMVKEQHPESKSGPKGF